MVPESKWDDAFLKEERPQNIHIQSKGQQTDVCGELRVAGGEWQEQRGIGRISLLPERERMIKKQNISKILPLEPVVKLTILILHSIF